MKEKYNKYINENPNFDKATTIGIICSIIVISGIFGFWFEFIFYYFNGGMQHLYWRGGNFLPWINIYAYGALGIYFLTFKYRKNPLKVFLISMLICGILEFASGYVMYTFFDGWRCWDYNKEILNFGNIGGFVCFRSVSFFGLAGLLLIYVIIPLLFEIARKMNKKVFLTISITLCVIFIIDELYNLIFSRIFHIPRARDVYEKLGFNFVKF